MSEHKATPPPAEEPRFGPEDFPASFRIASGLLIAFLVITALYVMESVFRPFFVALFLSFAFRPLARIGRKGRGSRILSYGLAGVAVFVFFFVATQVVAGNLSDFGSRAKVYQERLHGYYDRAEDTWTSMTSWAGNLASQDSEPLDPVSSTSDEGSGAVIPPEPKAKSETAEKTPARSPEMLENRILDMFRAGGAAILSALGEGIVILVFMLLMMMELDRIDQRVRDSFPDKPQRAATINQAIGEVDKAIQKYIVLKIVVSLLTGAVSAIILALFDVPYVLTFALLIFLFNFIPYIGSVIATVAPVLICILDRDSENALLIGVALGVLLSGVQQIIGNLVEPKLQGKDLQLSPVIILLALAFWGWIWGITGMILAVPLMSTVKIVLARFDSTKDIARLLADVDLSNGSSPMQNQGSSR
jgi:AI-2 transport protein TqsA